MCNLEMKSLVKKCFSLLKYVDFFEKFILNLNFIWKFLSSVLQKVNLHIRFLLRMLQILSPGAFPAVF